jgi:hypothetical protein
MNQKRQPKGTDTGGQFTPDSNPECTLELAPEPKVSDGPSTMYHCDNCDEVSFEEVHDCGTTCREIDPDDVESMEIDGEDVLEGWGVAPGAEPDGTPLTAAEREELGMPVRSGAWSTIAQREEWISNLRGHIAKILKEKESREDSGGDTLDQLIDEGRSMDEMKEMIISQQQGTVADLRAQVETLRKDREENPSLKDIVCMRTFDYLNEGDDVEEADDGNYGGRGAQDPLSRETIASDFDRYEMDDPQGRDWDGAFQGIDYVVESLVSWRIADQARVDKEQLEAVSAREDQS